MNEREAVRQAVRAMAVKIGMRDYLRRHPKANEPEAKAWAMRHRLRYMDMAFEALAFLFAGPVKQRSEG